VLPNNGDGTFAPFVTYDVDEDQRYLTFADLSSDGHQDLAVLPKAGRYKLAVLFNRQDGTFISRESYPDPIPGSPVHPDWNGVYGMATGDLDCDGDLDLVISVRKTNLATGNVIVMLNDGAGSFTETGPYRFGENLNSVVIGDLNGDSLPDIAVSDWGTDFLSDNGGVWVLLNMGNATFGPPASYPVVGSARSVALADVDGDGDLDLPAANCAVQGRRIFLFTNNGDGTLVGPVPLDAGAVQTVGLTLADLDGDERADIACTSTGNDVIAVLINNGDGSFGLPVLYPAVSGGLRTMGPYEVLAMDLDGDEDLDL